MLVKLCTILLAIGLSQAVAYPPLQLNNPHQNLVQFLIQSRDLGNDESHTFDCMNYYLPLLNEVVETYRADVNACVNKAIEEVAQINDNTKEERNDIDNSAKTSCNALTACSAIESAIDYFSCYSEAGANNTKTMFTISANASELLAAVQEEVRLIKVKEEVCTNKTQRAYGEAYGQLYADLGDCIAGAPIPSESTSTQASSTDSSTDSSSASTESSTDSSSASTDSSTDSSSASTESSTDSSSVSTESSTDSSTDSSSASTESSTDSSSASTESSTDSSSVSTESSTDSSTDSSSVSTESSTDSSTDSSSASTESSTDSSSVSTESTTSSGEKEAPPEEDLKSLSSQNSNDLQKILKNLRAWFKNH
ncbi:suppressor protein SRP40 [Drosophila sechellia]|uniref:GM19931 n=1 Tax=Drosophila sechellia TaxID=7238 RepID=B4HNB2_DROSE|nr:suppressor protein SRP40 [Drosophila sechellia]EDW48394.1 GM19931 [Drosophila sechellia]